MLRNQAETEAAVSFRVTPAECLHPPCLGLELHKNGQVDKVLILAKVREPDAADPTAACRFRWTEEGLARRAAIVAGVKLRRTVIAARGRDAARAGPIGNT